MRTILLIPFLFCFQFVQAKDYEAYFNDINKAEYKIFVQKDFDSGLYIYEKVFCNFDFVYLNDCITAMQISILQKNEKLFLIFVNKAFQNGLKTKDLAQLKYINNSLLYIKNKEKIQNSYVKQRDYYIKRINIELLNKMYKLFANDQMAKNGSKNQIESDYKHEEKYKLLILATTKELKHIAYTYGFPSDKLIGVSQNNIMKELGSAYLDLPDYYDKNKYITDKLINKSQFDLNEFEFGTHLVLPIMHHFEHSFEHSFLQFDTSFYIQEIKKGNIHPKDVAAINDFPYATLPPKPIEKNGCYFGVGVRFKPPNSLCVSDSVINQNRKKFFIQKIEFDRMKWEFMYKAGMYYNFGYLGCRS